MRQKEDALARGIRLMEWTFDPMELKNAFLNLEKLGAIIRRYNPNQYGMTSSPLHGALPTNRTIAQCRLDGPPPGEAGSEVERISYPSDIAAIRASDPSRARAIQQANAVKFQDAFGRGFAVTHFERSESEGTYVLEPWK